MDLLAYFLVALVLSWLGYLLFVQIKANSLIGRPSEDIEAVCPQLDIRSQSPYIVFCYAKSCGPCRAMKPDMVALREETGRVCLIDLSQNQRLAAKLHIRTVPTVLVIQSGMIKHSLLGKHTKNQLLSLLEGAEPESVRH